MLEAGREVTSRVIASSHQGLGRPTCQLNTSADSRATEISANQGSDVAQEALGHPVLPASAKQEDAEKPQTPAPVVP